MQGQAAGERFSFPASDHRWREGGQWRSADCIRRVLEISDDVLASKPPQMAVNAATREVIRARAGRVGALLLRKYPSKNAKLRIQDEHLDIFCRFAFPLVYGVNVAVLYRTLP